MRGKVLTEGFMASFVGSSAKDRTDSGATRLILAAASGRLSDLKRFVEEGYDINAQNYNLSRGVWEDARINYPECYPKCTETGGNTALIWAVADAQEETAIWLIEQKGILLDIQSTYATENMEPHNSALILAIAKGPDHKDVDRTLKNKGDRQFPPQPLRGVVDALIAHGADVKLANVYGNTALHFAFLHRDIETIDKLLESGARLDVRNKEGKTPADLLLLSYSDAGKIIEKSAVVYTMKDEGEWTRLGDVIREKVLMSKETKSAAVSSASAAAPGVSGGLGVSRTDTDRSLSGGVAKQTGQALPPQ